MVTGVGGLSLTPTPTYSNNVDAGTAAAAYTYAGDANHNGSNDSKTFVIGKAGSTLTVSCPTTAQTYTGAALAVCSAQVTGVGGLDHAVTPVTYTNNTNVGTAGASASFAGDANHEGSSNTASFEIAKAGTSVTVACPTTPQTYTGAALQPCTASATGAGMATPVSLSPTYTGNVNAGTATASASYAGDDNHTGSTGSSSFTISKAASTVTVTCSASVLTYTASAIQPCTAKATGAGGLDQTLTVTYSANVNVGTATATATFAGDANHTGNSGSASFSIQYLWDGFLQPINDTAHDVHTTAPYSKFKLGQTIPAKFDLKDANGNIVTQTGNPIVQLQEDWQLVHDLHRSRDTGPELPGLGSAAVHPDRWALQYNWSTKGLPRGSTRSTPGWQMARPRP